LKIGSSKLDLIWKIDNEQGRWISCFWIFFFYFFRW